MDKMIALPEEAEEARERLPIVPIAFGSGSKFPAAGEAHLLLSVREGGFAYAGGAGEETVGRGQMLFIRRGSALDALQKSDDFDCEFVLFEASEDFLRHLELPDVAVGEVGEGCGLTTVAKMSAYALEYYHDCLKICAAVYASLAKIARDRMIAQLERFDNLTERLSPALLQIEQRYGEALTVPILAHACAMGESHFARAFKQVYGCSPIRYLIRVRVEKAKALLADTDLPFEEIARQCGFGTTKYFGDVLKKYEHVSPRELRTMYRSMTQVSFF
mgnify:CR=1 FL=1